MKLGLDMDGVLANFEYGFIQVLAELHWDYGELLDNPAFPEVWDWPSYHNIPQTVQGQVWDRIKASESFWRFLPNLQGTQTFEAVRMLNDLARRGHDIYFVTNRMGNRAKWQTEQWLHDRGFKNPTVLLAAQKGLAAKALRLDAYVDDKPENVVDAHVASDSQVFLFDRPYNQTCQTGQRVTSLQEMLSELRLDGDYRPGSYAGATDAGHAHAAAPSNHHRYRV